MISNSSKIEINDNTFLETPTAVDPAKQEKRFLEILGVLANVISNGHSSFIYCTPENHSGYCLFSGININSVLYIDVRISQLMNSTYNIGIKLFLINHEDGVKLKIFDDLRFEKAYLVLDFDLRLKLSEIGEPANHQYIIEESLKSISLDKTINHHRSFRLNLLRYGKWAALLADHLNNTMDKEASKFQEIDDDHWYQQSIASITQSKNRSTGNT